MGTLERVRHVLAATFGLPAGRIPPDASTQTLPEWDSVGHVNLMMSLEQEFGLFLDVEDFARLTSIPRIVSFLDASAARA